MSDKKFRLRFTKTLKNPSRNFDFWLEFDKKPTKEQVKKALKQKLKEFNHEM